MWDVTILPQKRPTKKYLKLVRKMYHRDAVKRYEDKDPNIRKARRAVAKAIKDGILIKPEQCPICGNYHRIIEFHHTGSANIPYPYDPANYLVGIFVCKKCHEAIHEQIDKLKAEEDRLSMVA